MNQPTDLLLHLFEQYETAVGAFEKSGHAEELVHGARQFLEFAREYLTSNRPRSAFTITNGIGIILSNGARLSVAPGQDGDVSGTMLPVTGDVVPVDVIEEATPRTYAMQGAVPISGFARKPKHAIDYSDKNYGAGQPYVDKAKDKPELRYNTRMPVVVDPLNP